MSAGGNSTGSFVAWRVDLNDPRRGDEGIAWAGAVGGAQDAELALVRTASLSRLPATCPDDGLEQLGLAYALQRLPGQSNASYRATLVAAMPTYQIGASPGGIISALHSYGIVNVAVFPDEQSTYPAGWYSRFDVVLGPNFGTLAVQRAVISPLLCTTTASFLVPAAGLNVTITVDAISPGLVGAPVYIAQAGFYQVISTGAGTAVVKNLGGPEAACALLGLTPGTLGHVQNVAITAVTVPTGQPVVVANAMIIGPAPGGTRIGVAIVADADRQAVKADILRWKAVQSYPGAIVMLWDTTVTYYSADPYRMGWTYIGRMIGLSMWIGVTPIGGYDRT